MAGRRLCLIVLVAAALLISNVSPAMAREPVQLDGLVEPGEYDDQAVFDDGRYVLHWRVEGETFYFAVDAETTGWVSLGIEPDGRMQGADMLFGWVNDDGSVGALDCYATDDWGTHPPDEELGGTDDILAVAGSQAEGRTIIEMARPLETGDAFDRAIPVEGSLRIIWAYGAQNEYTSRHSAAGAATIDLVTGVAAATSSPRIWPLHAASTSLGFLLVLAGALIARYRKRKRGWLKTHRALTGAGGAVAVVGAIIGWLMVAATGLGHWRGVHSYLGATVTLLLLVTPTLGLVQLKVPPATGRRLRPVHRWLGRVCLVLMALQITLGVLIVLGIG